MPHLFRVIVPVDDIEHAARFYGSVLGFAGERVSPGRHYFSCEGTILACYDAVADGDDRGQCVSVSVDGPVNWKLVDSLVQRSYRLVVALKRRRYAAHKVRCVMPNLMA